MMADMFADVKAGDEVVLFRPARVKFTKSIEKIDRVTKTQIIIGPQRFRRSSGRKVAPQTRYGGNNYIEPITRVRRDKIEHENAQRNRRRIANHFLEQISQKINGNDPIDQQIVDDLTVIWERIKDD